MLFEPAVATADSTPLQSLLHSRQAFPACTIAIREVTDSPGRQVPSTVGDSSAHRTTSGIMTASCGARSWATLRNPVSSTSPSGGSRLLVVDAREVFRFPSSYPSPPSSFPSSSVAQELATGYIAHPASCGVAVQWTHPLLSPLRESSPEPLVRVVGAL